MKDYKGGEKKLELIYTPQYSFHFFRKLDGARSQSFESSNEAWKAFRLKKLVIPKLKSNQHGTTKDVRKVQGAQINRS